MVSAKLKLPSKPGAHQFRQTKSSPSSDDDFATSKRKNIVNSKDHSNQHSTKNHPKLKGGNDGRSFRSSFRSMVLIMKEVKDYLSSCHLMLNEMDRTPFKFIFRSFYGELYTETMIMKYATDLVKILNCCRREEDGFLVGNTIIKLREEDIAIILGLPISGKQISLHSKTSYPRTEFVVRHFGAESTMNKKLIGEALKETVKNKRSTDVKDFSILWISYFVTTVLATTTGGKQGLNLLDHILDPLVLSSIGWAKVIHTELMSEIRVWNPKNPYTINSCCVILLYFICDHTSLISQIEVRSTTFPRCARWSFSTLTKSLKEIEDLQNVKDLKVSEDILNLADVDKRWLRCEPPVNYTKDEVVNLILRYEAVKIENQNLQEVTPLPTSTGLHDELPTVTHDEPPALDDGLHAPDEEQPAPDEEQPAPDDEPHTKKSSPTKQSPQPKQRSMIKALKEKTRKVKDMEGFQMNYPRKKTRAKIREVVDVDTYMVEHKEIPAKLKGVTKSPIWKQVSDKGRIKNQLIEFFKNANTHTVVWMHPDGQSSVRGMMIQNLMFNKFVADEVVHWYTHFSLKHDKKQSIERKSTMFYFSGFFYTMIRGTSSDRNKNKMCWEVVKNIKDHQTRINWYYYNSLKSSLESDEGRKHVLQLKALLVHVMASHIFRCCTKAIMDIALIKLRCPAQGEFPDCAIFVYYYMQKIAQEDSMFESEDNTLCQQKMQIIRALIAWQLITSAAVELKRNWICEDSNNKVYIEA